MVLFPFGSYSYICSTIPSLPTCNIFFRQLAVHPYGITAPASSLLGLPTDVNSTAFMMQLASYPSGSVNPACGINRMSVAGGQIPGSLGNIANIILCAISVLVGLGLATACSRRVAAVGRVEMRFFFTVFALVQVLQLLDTGGIFQAGSTVITWISGIHMGLVVGLFFILAWCGSLSLQLYEDGTFASIIPLTLGFGAIVIGSSYIFLDTAFTVTSFFQSNPASDLHSIPIFVLTIIWPAVAAAFYFVVQAAVVVRVLRETKPLLLFAGSAFLFILSQGAYYALSFTICHGTNAKVDGSFLATLLETMAVGVLYLAWKSITESSWDGVAYMD